MNADAYLSRRLTQALGMTACWVYEQEYGWSLFVDSSGELRRLCSYGFDVADEDKADELALRDLELLRYLLAAVPR